MHSMTQKRVIFIIWFSNWNGSNDELDKVEKKLQWQFKLKHLANINQDCKKHMQDIAFQRTVLNVDISWLL